MQWELSASSPGFALLMPIAGLVVVAVLIAAFAWGRRIRARESRPPRPEEQPHLPDDGPVREEREFREPDEVPRSSHRLTTHDLEGYGSGSTHRSVSQEPPEEKNGDGGSFGSGGLG